MVSGSFSGRGLKDWLWQRFTAVYLLAYFIYLGVLYCCSDGLSFGALQSLISSFWFSAASFIAILCILVHAWIGMWTVATDYINRASVRLVFLATLLVVLLAELFWGVRILWL